MNRIELCKCSAPLIVADSDCSFCASCKKEIPAVSIQRAEKSTTERPGFFRGARVKR